MSMRHLSAALLALLVGSLPALAADYATERGHLICTTQQSLHDAQEAYSKHDRGWLESIKECGQSTDGRKAELLVEGPLSIKVKIYDETGAAAVYWTSPTTLKDARR
jgi:hypothetical protein